MGGLKWDLGWDLGFGMGGILPIPLIWAASIVMIRIFSLQKEEFELPQLHTNASSFIFRF